MSEEMTFVYLRAGDAVGATRSRVLTNSPLLLKLMKKGGGVMSLPEGREVLEFRKEQEEAGVEFAYRIVDFNDWFKQADDKTVQKWLGTHEDSVYPEAPEGTFWQEWADEEGNWTVGLLSMTDGQPVDGHEDLVEETREALLKKSAGEEAGEPVPSDEDEDEDLPSETPEDEGAEAGDEEDAPEESDEE